MVQGLRLHAAPNAQSLGGELRSHMLCSQEKKKEEHDFSFPSPLFPLATVQTDVDQRWKPYVRRLGTTGQKAPTTVVPVSYPDFHLERNKHLAGVSSCYLMSLCYINALDDISIQTAMLDSTLSHLTSIPITQSYWLYPQNIWPFLVWPFLTLSTTDPGPGTPMLASWPFFSTFTLSPSIFSPHISL